MNQIASAGHSCWCMAGRRARPRFDSGKRSWPTPGPMLVEVRPGTAERERVRLRGLIPPAPPFCPARLGPTENAVNPLSLSVSRRDMLRRLGGGFGVVGLAGVLAGDTAASDPAVGPLAPKAGHHP